MEGESFTEFVTFLSFPKIKPLRSHQNKRTNEIKVKKEASEWCSTKASHTCVGVSIASNASSSFRSCSISSCVRRGFCLRGLFLSML